MPILGLILSILLGFLPMFLFAYLVFWTDRYEKEPFLLLGGVFIWGAIVAAGAAFTVNSFLGLGIYMFTGSHTFADLSTSSVIAPIIEETLKGIACLLVFLYFRREFDSILDGIVYAAITALGFAATENVYYLYTYGFQENGLSGILWMLVHSCNSCWMAAPILYCIHRDRLSNRTPQPKSMDHHIRSHLGIGHRNHNPFDPQQHLNRFSRLTRTWNWIDL